MRVRGKQRSQAIVEFGLIALLFTSLMFAIVDFGLLLNTWLAVSSGTRDIARSAAVGKNQTALLDQAQHLGLPSVSTAGFSGGPCCHRQSAVEVQVDYLDCSPVPPSTQARPLSSCSVVTSSGGVSQDYPFQWVDSHGSGASVLGSPGCLPTAGCHPQAGDYVRVTVTAHGAQVITPLVRLAFDNCRDGSNPNCYVDLRSSVTMRVEGQEL